MVFSSFSFLFLFLPVVLAVYFILPGIKVCPERNLCFRIEKRCPAFTAFSACRNSAAPIPRERFSGVT